MSPRKEGKEQNSGSAGATANTLNAAALAELLQQGAQGGDISQLLRQQQLLQQQQLPQLSALDTLLLQNQGQNAAGLQLLLQQQQGELDQLLSRARLEQQQQQMQLASLLSGNAHESTNVRFTSDEVKQEKKGDGESQSKPSSPAPSGKDGKRKDDDQDDEEPGVAAAAGDAAEEENPEDLENDTFPFKLFRMLAKVEEDGKQDIVSFTSNNRAFIIHKPHKFTNEIMPEYFTTTRMSSFQRQLNLYGFRRITEGPSKGAYFHEFFQKGKLSWCNRIKRKKNSVKAPPNFFGTLAPSFAGLPGGIAPALTVRQMLADPSGLMGLQAAGLGGMGMINPTLNLGVLGQPNNNSNNLAAVLALQQQKEQVEALQQLLLNQQRQQQR